MPAAASPVRCSPPSPMPISTAHTGSVPSSRLARAGEVQRTAHSCTTNAKTLQPSARYSTPSHSPAPSPVAAGSSAGPAAAVKTTAPTTVCTVVSVRVS